MYKCKKNLFFPRLDEKMLGGRRFLYREINKYNREESEWRCQNLKICRIYYRIINPKTAFHSNKVGVCFSYVKL